MAPISFYRCSKCKREYQARKDATACEDSHLKVVKAKIKQYSIHQYPYMLEVTFSNGITKEYVADDMH